ncbi:MAG: hypothetical protein M1827_004130 [Pycnora praestabilis]|nr:MAG: hypothetical protein M1827_004130 [Pycnora praestabilis]
MQISAGPSGPPPSSPLPPLPPGRTPPPPAPPPRSSSNSSSVTITPATAQAPFAPRRPPPPIPNPSPLRRLPPPIPSTTIPTAASPRSTVVQPHPAAQGTSSNALAPRSEVFLQSRGRALDHGGAATLLTERDEDEDEEERLRGEIIKETPSSSEGRSDKPKGNYLDLGENTLLSVYHGGPQFPENVVLMLQEEAGGMDTGIAVQAATLGALLEELFCPALRKDWRNQEEREGLIIWVSEFSRVEEFTMEGPDSGVQLAIVNTVQQWYTVALKDSPHWDEDAFDKLTEKAKSAGGTLAVEVEQIVEKLSEMIRNGSEYDKLLRDSTMHRPLHTEMRRATSYLPEGLRKWSPVLDIDMESPDRCRSSSPR